MHSISESFPKGYIPKYSSDCFDGIMSATAKTGIVNNTYTKYLLLLLMRDSIHC